MGRHGKNNKRPPQKIMQALGPINPDTLLNTYEKQMLSENVKKDYARKVMDTCNAATAHILLYHADDLAACPPDERLWVYYGLLERILNTELDSPDEKQQFVEWYWSACTGNPLIRASKEKEYKMAKKYSHELSLALKKRIDAQGYEMADVCSACNISRGTYYNVTGGGNYSKKSFDTVAEFIGLEMDADLKALYDQRFGIGNPQQVERMEEMALEIEKKQAVEPAPAEEKAEAPEAVEPIIGPAVPIKPIPVGEGLEEMVEQVLEHEAKQEETANEEAELPYKDVNEMYREGKAEATDNKGGLMDPDGVMSNLEFYSAKIPQLQEALDLMRQEAKKLEKFIKILELFKE